MSNCDLVLARYLLPGLFLCSLFQDASAESLHAAILPNDAGKMYYSDSYASSKRFFATILNDTQQLAEGCRLELSGDLPLQLDYFATERVLNRYVGPTNTPVTIPAKGSQTFGFDLQLTADEHIPKQHAGIRFVCDSLPTAQVIPEINDVMVQAGEPPLPNILFSIATDHPENRLVLDPEPNGEPCTGVRYGGEAPKPCAVGAVALAVLNAEPVPVRLRLYPEGMGSPWLLCQTNSLGECIKTGTYDGLELSLSGDEVATFSAYFLTFDDWRFGPSGDRRAGFDIQEITSPSYRGVRAVATATVPVESPPFEWHARVTEDELNVTGSVWVGNSCAVGTLTEFSSEDTAELRLKINITTDVPPNVSCGTGFGKYLVNFFKPSVSLELERVIVMLENAEDLELAVDRE